MTVLANKLANISGSQKGNFVCDNERRITKLILFAMTICLKKYSGSRSSFPLKNNLAESHPISNIIPPNNL
ncbi:hypothetical protein IQ240_06870 [Nodularia sp. LEGE 04288]|nr:hypothetical protein [Nodularia sp. LEGE 04288]